LKEGPITLFLRFSWHSIDQLIPRRTMVKPAKATDLT
jgi:hypothetical protein